MALNYKDIRHQKLEQVRLPRGDTLDLGLPFGKVNINEIRSAAASWETFTKGEFKPQVALLVYAVTSEIRALDHYSVFCHSFDNAEMTTFYNKVQEYATHPNLRVALYDEESQFFEVPHIKLIVTIALMDIFYFQLELLDWLLQRPCHFHFFTTKDAYLKVGGIAGGCYAPNSNTILLQIARLFEGYYSPTPGSAPIFHELGHMLDYTHRNNGLVHGLHPYDGASYNAEARSLFLRGKRLELARYQTYCQQLHSVDLHPLASPITEGELPVGYPYAFDGDDEFIAYYLQMFLRCPHYFATQNPDLYKAFALLFNQDPRKFWTQDYRFYIQQNRMFYLSARQTDEAQLTILED
jgi:hypothetical protein